MFKRMRRSTFRSIDAKQVEYDPEFMKEYGGGDDED
jgi:hypothetical protein